MTNSPSVLAQLMEKPANEPPPRTSPSLKCPPINVPHVSCSLKRKRPPKIEIPNVLQEIQANALKVKDVTPQDDAVSFCGLGVGVFSVKGKKKFMEDTHKIVSCLHGNSNKAFFGVYDGHGGKKAAEFVAENLHNNIFEMLKNCRGNEEKEEAVKAGYLKTDEEFLKQKIPSGTCCVTALIEGEDIVVSNLGDCRAVLCRGGVAEALTTDHKAEREDERKRIENKGGYVEFHRGAWRVHGILSVSRSIGDAHLKDWVLADPDTEIFKLTPEMEFLVLASDGLWEEVSSQEAVDIVARVLVGKKPVATGVFSKENENDSGCVNISPSSKIRRVSLVKQQKETSQSPRHNKNIDSEDDYACENGSPPSKLRRISLVKRISMKPDSPNQENNTKLVAPGVITKENEDDYGCVNVSPSSKIRRVSLVKQQKETWSPRHNKNIDSEDDHACENGSPPSKLRRISLVKRISLKPDSPSQENNTKFMKRPSSSGLMAACKELVNLAVSRGSLDDITIMIIDLNQFRCNS
ncbi:phosphatase 2C (PP2C)-like protein [Corchorus olitorius]|uniref:protein-serine/threonine phosphatase n=1 Tax=Corchorus olitorius TaxID=93759 RepID=A0A1R3IGE4_9ROSI|nr:phosphatase 2C (PP2C)-like protein [Corchorus olitorius]